MDSFRRVLARSRRFSVVAASVLAGTLVAGCGGDYGNTYACGYDAYGDPIFCSVGPVVPEPVPVTSSLTFAPAQTLVNAATQPFSASVSAFDAFGNSYTISNSAMPGSAATFNGTAAITSVLSQTFYENGIFVSSDATTSYYNPAAADAFLGSGGLFPGEFEVVTSYQPAPATALVGQSFPRLTANLYHDATQAVLDGTLTETLVIEPDTAATALVCENDIVQPTASGSADGLSSQPTSFCYRTNTSGSLLGLQISTPVGGTVLTFQ